MKENRQGGRSLCTLGVYSKHTQKHKRPQKRLKSKKTLNPIQQNALGAAKKYPHLGSIIQDELQFTPMCPTSRYQCGVEQEFKNQKNVGKKRRCGLCHHHKVD